MDTDPVAWAQELRGIAAALRSLPTETTAPVHRLRLAGKYLGKALELDAFAEPGWVRFRTAAEHWFQGELPFVSASHWMKQNGASLGIQVDQSKPNGDLGYWCPFFADLIDADVREIEEQYRRAATAQAQAPRNWWKAVNHWWQHNLIATAIVVVFIIIPAIRGLFAFYNDLMSLLCGGR